MKKILALLLALGGSSVALAAEQADYIPWTFDDFDQNGKVVDGPVSQAVAEAAESSDSRTDNGKPEG